MYNEIILFLMAKDVKGYLQPPVGKVVYIPVVLIPLWQMKLRERYGLDVDREIVRIILEEKYSNSTWKWSRAIKRIEEFLAKKGVSRENAVHLARKIVNVVSQ